MNNWKESHWTEKVYALLIMSIYLGFIIAGMMAK